MRKYDLDDIHAMLIDHMPAAQASKILDTIELNIELIEANAYASGFSDGCDFTEERLASKP